MGKEYWRSLDELADTPEYRRLVESEFPGLAEELLSPATRRSFLKVMGASLAAAGLTGCRWPKELVLPFAHRPEGRIPGVPSQYATAVELGGHALGALVTSYDGRPIKIEGNPLHPTSRGAATALMQALVLELYDPDRSTQVMRRESGQELAVSWEDFAAFSVPHFAALRQARGAGLAVLSEATSSPGVAALRGRLAAELPAARWHEYEPLSRDHERAGTAIVFGEPYRPQLHLERARVIVCLDADPLFDHPASLAHARDFSTTRTAEAGWMSRMWVAESMLSLTGALADHRVALRPSEIAPLAAQLAGRCIERLKSSTTGPLETLVETLRALAPAPVAETFLDGVVADLEEVLGQAVVIAGPRQPPEVHALVHFLNVALGAVGNTVTYAEDLEPARPSHVEAIAALAREIAAARATTLLILGGNPAFDAPADLGFGAALARVPVAIRLGLHDDETSHLCRWHVPRAHALESWGDVRAWDGTVSVVQPLIEPLYGGKTPAEMISLLLDERPAAAHEIARRSVQELTGAPEDEGAWRRALHDGVVAGSAFAEARPRARLEELQSRLEGMIATGGWGRASGYELVFVPDPKVHDGRFANNAWLQELPDPLSRITWDNAALLAPVTAAELSVRTGDLITLSLGGRELEIAAFVMPGQAAGTVVVPVGYGRTAAGRVGTGAGFDVYPLRTTAAIHFAGGLQVRRTGRSYRLACTEDHHAVDAIALAERGLRIAALVREGTLAEYLAESDFAARRFEAPAAAPLFKELSYDGEHQWAMAIDLSACVGCNACVVACQAENNIAVVGKDQVARGREMHWLRVDRYFTGKADDPKVAFQPVACQHCENAPCEQVCPVGATMHSAEGLNEMVYNRCVGTRYCSNNCPYKVRRFNYLNYHKKISQVEKMAYNPEVTIRSRGVMEKCTYCIQRIEAVKIAAGNERRPIRDGEITPACAQTCPTRAITFGDLRDPESRVGKLHHHHRAYAILAELATKPRTRYLARLRNPAAGREEG